MQVYSCIRLFIRHEKKSNPLSEKEFKTIFDQWFNPLRAYLIYRSGDEELATDIAQETMLIAWQKNIYTQPKFIPAMLYKIAGDLFVSYYRKQQSATKYQLTLASDNHSLTPEEVINYQETNAKYEKILAQLPEGQRTVYLMSRLEALHYKEIAIRLGIGVKAVEKRMSNALSTLRQKLINE